jgi:hypothetical protein
VLPRHDVEILVEGVEAFAVVAFVAARVVRDAE